MKIRQLVSEGTISTTAADQMFGQAAKLLQAKLGTFLERLGGPGRIYDVDGTSAKAAIYIVKGTVKGISLVAEGGNNVSYLQFWKNFSLYNKADFTIALPTGINFTKVVDTVASLLRNPVPGPHDILAPTQVKEMAVRTTEADFLRMAQQAFGAQANKLSWAQITQVASENDVQVPGSIRFNRELKVDANHWNLSGGPAAGDVTSAVAKQHGLEVTNQPEVDQDEVDWQAAKGVARLAAQGKLYLFGRDNKNRFYAVKNVEQTTAQLERMLARQLASRGNDGKRSMEEQYEELHDRVELVAGGQSNFIKSILITGAPSSGKTFTVMKTIKSLGLEADVDYMVKKGRVTANTLYRALIEQIDGLLIFDDCDSVVEDKNAINMLKGALDTDPVRELSYDVRGGYNTAVMKKGERDEIVMRMSRILRGKPEDGDLDFFKSKVRKEKKKKEEDSYSIDSDDDFSDIEDDDDLLSDVQQWVSTHLPNKIDFQGRIIFISNMDEDEWDSAILTRAMHMNMNFSDSEMLDYIDKIKGHIRCGLDDDQKQEVMDYIRELWQTGVIKRQINFRLIQQAFDYRLVSSWKKLVATL